MTDHNHLQAAFYRAAFGPEPVRDWLLDLPNPDRRVVAYDVSTGEYGCPIGMPTCRFMGQRLYEIRSVLPSNSIARVFFCVPDGHMVLLYGRIKKTQATQEAAST